MAAPPKFRREDRPPFIVNTCGQWLASELGGGFRWVESTRALKLDIAPGRTAEIRLRPSHWNMAGVLTHVQPHVTVRDRGLAKWRRAHGRHHSGLVADTSADVVWSIEMVNLDHELDDIELFGDVAAATNVGRRKYLKLPDLLTAIRTRIVPKLRAFESPGRAATELPDIWLAQPAPMIDWATSLGDLESARLISTRAKKLTGELPPETELEAVLAQGRRLLETLRSERRHVGLISNSKLDPGLQLVNRMVREISDPAGRTDRVPRGSLTRWAGTLGEDDSSLRTAALAFDLAAAAHLSI